jgi:hypothetical protein
VNAWCGDRRDHSRSACGPRLGAHSVSHDTGSDLPSNRSLEDGMLWQDAASILGSVNSRSMALDRGCSMAYDLRASGNPYSVCGDRGRLPLRCPEGCWGCVLESRASCPAERNIGDDTCSACDVFWQSHTACAIRCSWSHANARADSQGELTDDLDCPSAPTILRALPLASRTSADGDSATVALLLSMPESSFGADAGSSCWWPTGLRLGGGCPGRSSECGSPGPSAHREGVPGFSRDRCQASLRSRTSKDHSSLAVPTGPLRRC